MLRDHDPVALADPLKEICADLVKILCGMDLPLETWYKDTDKAQVFAGRSVNGRSFSRRHVMQEVGDVLRKALGNDIFVRTTLQRRAETPSARTVVTDVRMPHEHEALMRCMPPPIVTLRIEDRHAATKVADAHETETAQADIPVDAVVYNDKTAGLKYLAVTAAEAIGAVLSETSKVTS